MLRFGEMGEANDMVNHLKGLMLLATVASQRFPESHRVS